MRPNFWPQIAQLFAAVADVWCRTSCFASLGVRENAIFAGETLVRSSAISSPAIGCSDKQRPKQLGSPFDRAEVRVSYRKGSE